MRRSTCALVLFGLLAARRASAEEPGHDEPGDRAEARAAYDRGAKLLDAGEDDAALEAFLDADTRVPSAEALDAAALAAARAHDARSLETLCRRVEERALDEPVLTRARAACDAKGQAFGAIEIACSAPCEVSVDGAPWGLGRRAIAEGTHALEIGRERMTLVVRRHERVLRAWSPKIVSAPRDTPSSPAARPIPPAWFFVGLAVTTALGAATIGSGIDTANTHARFVESGCSLGPSRRTLSDAACRAIASSGSSAATRTNVLAGVTGGVGLATALVGAIGVRWSSPHETAHVRVAPSALSFDVVF